MFRRDSKIMERQKLFYELYLHFNSANNILEEEYKRIDKEQRNALRETGEKLIQDAWCNGVKNIYYGNQELAIFCVMVAEKYDFKFIN